MVGQAHTTCPPFPPALVTSALVPAIKSSSSDHYSRVCTVHAAAGWGMGGWKGGREGVGRMGGRVGRRVGGSVGDGRVGGMG